MSQPVKQILKIHLEAALELLEYQKSWCPECKGNGSVIDDEGLWEECTACRWIWDVVTFLTQEEAQE